MTILDFIYKYIGKKVDFDGSYGAQCVDLVRQFNKDVFNFPHTGAVNGAVEMFDKYEELPVEKKYYERIQYTVPFCTPYEGDIIIFKPTESNKYGHVAIVLDALREEILVFEQDGFKQDGAKISKWNYDRVKGWLTRRRNV